MNRLGVVALFGIICSQSLQAQRTESLRVGISPAGDSRTLATPSAADSLRHPTATERSASTVLGALAGAAVGAAAGVGTAFVATHSRHYADHSEDPIAYIYFGFIGAVAGVVVGAVVGFIRA